MTTKLNVIVPLAVVAMAASTECALAGTTSVPGPVIGAGLPAIAVLAGGYWLIRKLRELR
jgi:hypothetical protein